MSTSTASSRSTTGTATPRGDAMLKAVAMVLDPARAGLATWWRGLAAMNLPCCCGTSSEADAPDQGAGAGRARSPARRRCMRARPLSVDGLGGRDAAACRSIRPPTRSSAPTAPCTRARPRASAPAGLKSQPDGRARIPRADLPRRAQCVTFAARRRWTNRGPTSYLLRRRTRMLKYLVFARRRAALIAASPAAAQRIRRPTIRIVRSRSS